MNKKTYGKPFQKGQSGNPGGRPAIPLELKELARNHSRNAIERLAYWMDNDDAKISIMACNALLDRGWGKPEQAVELKEDVSSRHLEFVENMNKYLQSQGKPTH